MALGEIGKKRKDEIIAEAVSLIGAGGIKALTMKKVADSIGINEASAYRYFPDKSALLVAIIEKVRAELIGPIRRLMDSELPPEAKLERIVAFHLRFVNDNDGLPLVFMAEIASGNEKELIQNIREIVGTYQELLGSLLSEMVGDNGKPSVHEFATMFFGMATAIAIQRRLGMSSRTHEEMADSLVPFLIRTILEESKGRENRK